MRSAGTWPVGCYTWLRCLLSFISRVPQNAYPRLLKLLQQVSCSSFNWRWITARSWQIPRRHIYCPSRPMYSYSVNSGAVDLTVTKTAWHILLGYASYIAPHKEKETEGQNLEIVFYALRQQRKRTGSTVLFISASTRINGRQTRSEAPILTGPVNLWYISNWREFPPSPCSQYFIYKILTIFPFVLIVSAEELTKYALLTFPSLKPYLILALQLLQILVNISCKIVSLVSAACTQGRGRICMPFIVCTLYNYTCSLSGTHDEIDECDTGTSQRRRHRRLLSAYVRNEPLGMQRPLGPHYTARQFGDEK